MNVFQTIQEELSNVDQDDNAVNYDDLAANLASNFLLKHKEKDVKAYVACCFADILRIYVPEPPYNELELKVRSGISSQIPQSRLMAKNQLSKSSQQLDKLKNWLVSQTSFRQ